MKKSKLLGWAFMALATITSCSEDTDVLSQESEIKLTSEITPSRVTALEYQSTQIVEGQKVGVTITGATTSHNNVVWNVGENGALINTGDKVYYGAGDATITAYHPYNSASSSYTFSVNTDQSIEANYRNSDLLWVTTTSSKTEDTVPLTFTHKLAKINVTLVPDKPGTDLSGATISICNTKISTTFNPTTGAISEASGDLQEIKAGVTTADAKTASAIVVPQTVNSGSQFIKIAHGGKTFYYSLPADKVLSPGCSHNYKLTVKELKVVALGSKIADWTAEEEEIADAEEVYETLLLPEGLTINEIVGEFLETHTDLKKIKFVTNSDVTSESILVTDADGTKGYLVVNGEWLEIHTNASEFVANANSSEMFKGDEQFTSPFNSLVHIDFGINFNTSNVTNVYQMFYYCSRLVMLDLSLFDTSNVTDMNSMFNGCNDLINLDLSSFDTSNVKNMDYMFNGCYSLTSLDLSSFNTSNVTDMYSMFNGCSALINLDLSSFDTSNVTDMVCMFYDCSSLTSLDLSSFNTSKVTNMKEMFNGCRSLNSLDLGSKFETSNVTDMQYMFGNCEALASWDVSSFNTQNVANMECMFINCSSLTSLDLSLFNTSNVTNMNLMFTSCFNLTSLDLSNFSFGKIPTVELMFKYVGTRANTQPIPIKVSADGYTYLTDRDCDIDAANAKFVKPDGTDW